MIITRDNKQVDDITLKRSEWCYFISKNGVKYVITNVDNYLVVTKPLGTMWLKPTKEIKSANIKIA